jgi:DNA-directed RNA polymerase subunit RPC12/RpoP
MNQNVTTYACPRCGHYAAAAPATLCADCEADKARGYEALTLTGRCANGAERDRGKLYHAVAYHEGLLYGYYGHPAVCGAKPGRRSNGWSDCKGRDVTCPRCAKKLEKERQEREQADAEAAQSKRQMEHKFYKTFPG